MITIRKRKIAKIREMYSVDHLGEMYNDYNLARFRLVDMLYMDQEPHLALMIKEYDEIMAAINARLSDLFTIMQSDYRLDDFSGGW